MPVHRNDLPPGTLRAILRQARLAGPSFSIFSEQLLQRFVEAVGRGQSTEFVEQRLRLFEVRRVKTFGKPAVDRCQKVAGLGAATLVAAQPSEADHGSQFPELGLLPSGNAESFPIQFLGGLGMALRSSN